MKIQKLQDQNATQEAIIKELQEQLQKIGKDVPEQEPMLEAEEDPHELPEAALAPPVFPQPNLYEQLMQDITRNPPARVESQVSSMSAQEVILESYQVNKNKSYGHLVLWVAL
jgi:nitrogenase subunit NifH